MVCDAANINSNEDMTLLSPSRVVFSSLNKLYIILLGKAYTYFVQLIQNMYTPCSYAPRRKKASR